MDRYSSRNGLSGGPISKRGPADRFYARAPRRRDLQTSLDHAAAGHRITAKVTDARLLDGISARELERHLAGRCIRGTDRHGKYLIAELDDDSALILHFGMTGTIETSAEGAATPRFEVLHIGLGKDRWASVTSRRKLGHIWLVGDVPAFLKDHDQGPDVLDEVPDAKALAAALGSKRSTLKSALMDQAHVSGIGNIYSDEILFQAQLHPLTLVGDLGQAEFARLHETTRRVLRHAIAHNLMVEGAESNFPDGWLTSHREPNGRCPRCGKPLATFKSGGRTGYFCPRCQRRRPARR